MVQSGDDGKDYATVRSTLIGLTRALVRLVVKVSTIPHTEDWMRRDGQACQLASRAVLLVSILGQGLQDSRTRRVGGCLEPPAPELSRVERWLIQGRASSKPWKGARTSKGPIVLPRGGREDI